MARIRGKAFWASLAKPNDKSGKFQIDVGHLTKESVAQLKADGVKVRKEESRDDDYPPRGLFITLKGNPDYPPKLFDAKKNQLPQNIGIGNGSEVVVVYKAFDWTFQGKKGTSAGLRTVQILDLVSYSDGVDELEVEDDGYTFDENDVKASSTAAADDLDGDDTDDDSNDVDLDDEIPF